MNIPASKKMKRSREFQYTGDQNNKKKQKRAKVMDESVEEVKVEKVGTVLYI